jgi:DNA primase
METLTRVGDDAALLPQVLAHYHLTAPLIDQSFAGTPVVYKNYPQGIDQPGDFKVTSFALTANKLLWLVHAKHAFEFYTWAPLLQDDDRLRFARVLLESPPDVPYERLKRAALSLRVLLHDMAKLEAIPLLDGSSGIALWIPFADAPHATPLRAWLHAFANRAAALYADLISTEHTTHKDGRVHLDVSSNAPGQFSALPYSLRAQGLRVCMPVNWNELERFRGADAFRVQDVPARLHGHGDVFAAEYARFAQQRFASIPNVAGGVEANGSRQVRPDYMWTPAPRGHIITATVEILGDGKARTSQEILTEALRRKLAPPNTQNQYVYSALIEYIARQLGRGRKPPIVQDAQKRFRINEPLDDWPDLLPHVPQKADEAAQALCHRLEATATGTNDSTAFENAVCDAFAHLGFLTQHLGQRGQPDGIADAI